jgi:hypothetical protein
VRSRTNDMVAQRQALNFYFQQVNFTAWAVRHTFACSDQDGLPAMLPQLIAAFH